MNLFNEKEEKRKLVIDIIDQDRWYRQLTFDIKLDQPYNHE